MENFEAFDPELKKVLGHRYQEQPVKKAVKKPIEKPAEEAPMDKPNWHTRLMMCVKHSWVFGAVSMLVFYWQQVGLMDSAAAVPTMYACALMLGLSVGKYGFGRR